MALTGEDALEVLRAADELGDRDGTFPDTVCTVARRLVPCAVVTFNRILIPEGRVEYTTQPSDRVSRLDAYRPLMERFAYQHPIVDHHVGTGSPTAFRLSDVASPDWTDTDLYRGYYAPLGLRHQLVLALPSPEEVMNVLALSRLAGDFSDRDVAVIDALRPALTLGCQSATTEALRRPTAIAGGWATVSVGPGDTVAAITDPDPTGTFVRGRPLPAELRDLGTRGPSPVGDPRTFVRGDHTWLVRVVSAAGAPRVLLVLRLDVDDPVLAGLSSRQREAVLALADGCSNIQIANRLGIAESTVKKHLRAAYRALGVSSRAAAIARLGHHDQRGPAASGL